MNEDNENMSLSQQEPTLNTAAQAVENGASASPATQIREDFTPAAKELLAKIVQAIDGAVFCPELVTEHDILLAIAKSYPDLLERLAADAESKMEQYYEKDDSSEKGAACQRISDHLTDAVNAVAPASKKILETELTAEEKEFLKALSLSINESRSSLEALRSN